MATVGITPDQDAVTAEIFIAAPPERVFQAITDPAQCRAGGDRKICTASLNPILTCAPGGSGRALGLARMARNSVWMGSTWRWIHHACSCIPGFQVTRTCPRPW